MEIRSISHSFSKTILCRSHCDKCRKSIRFFGLRCRLCRMKFHKGCSHLAGINCCLTSKRKSKTNVFRRPFADRLGKNRLKLNDRLTIKERDQDEQFGLAATTLKCRKLGSAVYPNNASCFTPLKNVYSPSSGAGPTYLVHSKPYGTSPIDLEEFYDLGDEDLHNTWHVTTAINHSRCLSNSGRSSAHNSIVSSGYSSVNQSCSSSAGTGSHRSRSPTPDQFETVKEEAFADEKYGNRLLDVSDRRAQRFVDDALHNVDRSSTSFRANDASVFFENDDESSGDWEDHGNCERYKPSQAFQIDLKELEIKYSDLEIDGEVGVGPHGPVFRGRWYGDVMIHTRETSKQQEVEEFRKEVALLSMIRHENVMLFMGACLEPPNLAVVTSLRKCLSIHSHLHCQESRLPMATRLNVMLQVAQGMSYLHAKSITVRCLRTMNIYWESKVKLCINECTYLHHQVKRNGYCSVPQGHLTYLAPEVISKINVDISSGRIVDTTVRNRKMDVYAYGTVMYEILTDKWPFATYCPETVIWMIGKGLPQSLAKVKGPDSVKDLIKNCWSLDPSQRPLFVDIIQVLKQKNLSTNCITRRHSISEPEKMHCIGKTSDLCHLQRI